MGLGPKPIHSLSVGQRIEHERDANGKIIALHLVEEAAATT